MILPGARLTSERASYIDIDEGRVEPDVLQQKLVLDGLINFLSGGQ